jgi:hypothetical protein
MPDPWDAFISHASEDKDGFVRPLAEALRSFGLRVWYDEFALRPGDSLSRSIDRGLAQSRFGVVVLSRAFFAKRWAQRELQGLVAREVAGDGGLILPIWLHVSRDEVLSYSPPLADTFALIGGHAPPIDLAARLLEVIAPERYDNLQRRMLYERMVQTADRTVVPLSDLSFGPIRHSTLPVGLRRRIRVIHEVFREAMPELTLDGTLDSFQRDLDPYGEVSVWESMAVAYLAMRNARDETASNPRELGKVLLSLSTGVVPADSVFSNDALARIAAALIAATPDLSAEAG